MPFLQSDVFRYIARGHAVNFPHFINQICLPRTPPVSFHDSDPLVEANLHGRKGQRLTVGPLRSGNILCSAHLLSVAPLMGFDRKWRYFVLNHGVPAAAVERTSWQIAAATVRVFARVPRIL